MAEQWLELYVQNPIAPFVNLTLIYNTGAAFSFLSEAGGWQRWFFSILAIGVSLLIIVWLKRLPKDQRWVAAGLALILGGALGNQFDRLLLGHVIDFIDVYYATYHWPTFNIADSAITIGASILVVNSLFSHRSRNNSTEH